MTTATYEVPFTYPEDIEVMEVYKMLTKHNLEIDAQTSWCPLPGDFLLTGTMEDLKGFFAELDGPAQSFPVSEFEAFVLEHN